MTNDGTGNDYVFTLRRCEGFSMLLTPTNWVDIGTAGVTPAVQTNWLAKITGTPRGSGIEVHLSTRRAK